MLWKVDNTANTVVFSQKQKHHCSILQSKYVFKIKFSMIWLPHGLCNNYCIYSYVKLRLNRPLLRAASCCMLRDALTTLSQAEKSRWLFEATGVKWSKTIDNWNIEWRKLNSIPVFCWIIFNLCWLWNIYSTYFNINIWCCNWTTTFWDAEELCQALRRPDPTWLELRT